ncbi:sulfotransferase family protein [Xenococcus sp. PCC 7305]|uniref:sulfotransferase domain-containing protein n=1 Tax=Xenococcus sp. PCC 7305 TaxID=102125 RepID=UPI0002ABFCD9|nr:sulfotransferase domain-containing protein [Xenococcus sp. PCC 7305]ELS03994.1 sulfotransferase family protein [Xenococcus sp. PCC 7305]
MSYEQIRTDRVLVNSLPKSGTHLLAKAIKIFGYHEYFTSSDYVNNTPKFLGSYEIRRVLKNQNIANSKQEEDLLNLGIIFPNLVPKSKLEYWLQCLPKSQYINGHIPYTPELNQVLNSLNYHHVCIIRDPRAVTVSRLKFIFNSESAKDILPQGIPLRADLESMSTTERINFLLEGGHGEKSGLTIYNFAQIYRSILDWGKDPNCLLVKFEDLIGEQGGGNSQKQTETLRNLAAHLNIPWDESIARQTKNVYDPKTRTFRVGNIHSWKNSLEPEDLARLTEYCEPLCQEAGYEV